VATPPVGRDGCLCRTAERCNRPAGPHEQSDYWQGDRASATAYYAQFIELWRDADPELQPQVRAAQQRLAQLLPDR
jgi:hypothetical protein